MIRYVVKWIKLDDIIDRYFDLFFVEIQLETENLKSGFWTPEFGRPNHRSPKRSEYVTGNARFSEKFAYLVFLKHQF